MKELIHYRGYDAEVSFSEADEVLHGKVIGILDLISFEGETVKELLTDFHHAVDEYIELCNARGGEPEKPFKGTFNVRIDVELHRKAALIARKKGVSLNAVVEEAIRDKVSQL